MIHLRLNESEIACGSDNATSVNSSIDYHKVTCPKCYERIRNHLASSAGDASLTKLVHWHSDSESFTTACGLRTVDFNTGDIMVNVARDYHKVTCKMCERWLRENMVNDDKRQQINQAFASDEAQGMLLEDVTGDFERDKRRWELAKELYTELLLEMRNNKDKSATAQQFWQMTNSHAQHACKAADALLDAFENQDKERTRRDS